MLNIHEKCYLISQYYRSILIMAAIATIVGGYYTSKLKLQTDLTALLPEHYESVKALNCIKEEVGGVGQLRLIFESKDFNAAKRLANDLSPRVLQSPLVKYVDYKNDVQFYKKNALLFLEPSELDTLYARIEEKIDQEKQELNPLFVSDLFGDEDEKAEDSEEPLKDMLAQYEEKLPKEYYTNADSSVLVMRIYPNESNSNLAFIRQMLAEVTDIVESADYRQYAPDMKVYYGGNFKNRIDEFETVKQDILGTALYGLGGVFLLIVIYFRRIVGAILISLTLLFSLAWTFGVTYAVLGDLNTITGFLFVILFGLGIDYGIHAFARYSESRLAGLSLDASIEKLVCNTGKALATTALTTSLAFFSLMLMDFKGFSDLGFIAGIGILFALVAMVVVLPAFIIFFEKSKLLKPKPNPSKTVHFNPESFRFARSILLISGLFALFSVYGLSQIGFQYDFTELRAITKERKIVSEKTRGVFSLSESPAVVLAGTEEEMAEIEAAVEQIMDADTLTPTIETTRSLYAIVPNDQPARLLKIRKIRQFVEDEAEDVLTGEDREKLDELKAYLQVDQPFTWEDFPEKDKRQFINKKGQIGKFVFIYPSVPLRDGRNAIEFRNDVGTIRTESGKVYHASSSNIILADMLLILIKEGRVAVVLTFVVVFLVLLLDFRNVKATLLVLSPLILAILWMTGVMFLSDMKFNFFNIVVIPSVIGIGVDNGVHIYHRYKEEGPGSLYYVLRTTGSAILMTTLTTLVGYSGLILASHPGLNSIGDLAVIGLTSAFVAAIFVLPALLHFFEKRNILASELVLDSRESV
ncbi:MAG: RND family transporter [bacterium]